MNGSSAANLHVQFSEGKFAHRVKITFSKIKNVKKINNVLMQKWSMGSLIPEFFNTDRYYAVDE